VTGDVDAISEALPLLEEIIYAFRDGTEFGIEMDQVDGLIRAGVPGQQLTWMDARANGQEVTPRIGKPVEINALWYNALQTIVHFRKTLNFIADEFISMAENASAGFQQFIRNDGLGLIDVLDGPEGNDIAIRPNQIFAISLTYSPLTEHDHKVAVLKTCHDFLLTAVGLRSLSRDGPSYVGHYDGGVAQRDGSYHQGTVWGWLLGHYALADFHVHGDAVKAQKHLENIPAHLYQAGIGQVSEIFDGDYPHEPKGAPAQAWSVACTLEAWWKLEIAKRDQL
jgi:predicted glycogen debranching enzyme